MLNYLFCLDKNYNKQLLISLNSLNFYSKTKFNVHIIHKDPTSLDRLITRSNIKFDKIAKFKTYQFEDLNFNFPNLENNHISEATYYRFFIDEYIEDNIDQLIYLDCDILCLNEPDDLLIEVSESLKQTNNVIAASVEYVNTVHTSELFNRLELKSNTYFNAGVMVIDFKAWKENNIKQKLLSAMEKIYDKVNFWDQDILNFVFDGSFLEISRNFNFSTQLNKNSNNIDLRSVIFLHYAGSNKPWTIIGATENISSEFHKNYFLLFGDRYYLITNYRKRGLADLFKTIFSLRILQLDSPLSFIVESIKSLRK
tara:strand:- start:2860 stop:3795 length:936 start_codon:yes stop_codon:yes gene_type:complete